MCSSTQAQITICRKTDVLPSISKINSQRRKKPKWYCTVLKMIIWMCGVKRCGEEKQVENITYDHCVTRWDGVVITVNVEVIVMVSWSCSKKGWLINCVNILHSTWHKIGHFGDVTEANLIRPGNRVGLFWFRCFINLSLTYLLRHLPTYLQSRVSHGGLRKDENDWVKCMQIMKFRLLNLEEGKSKPGRK